MKINKLYFITGLLISLQIVAANAQLLNLPESVVYDAPRHRYLVSNWGSGHIVQIDSAGTQSYFITNQQCFAGLLIKEDTIFVACREYGVKGFDLETGANVLNVPIPGATNINDITADNQGNLYVSYPTESIIYKVNITSQNFWVFTDQNLDTPNGLYYDEYNHRLLLVSYKNYSPVQQISLDDSVVTTVTNTTLHGLDGLTRDSDGNYYVSSWYSNACFRFDSTFANPPELFSQHADDPADISFDEINDVLAVPLFFTHGLDLVTVPLYANGESVSKQPDEFALVQCFPNPFNSKSILSFVLKQPSDVTLSVIDIHGVEIVRLVEGWVRSGSHSFTFDGSALPSGIYLVRLKAGNFAYTRKMLLLK